MDTNETHNSETTPENYTYPPTQNNPQRYDTIKEVLKFALIAVLIVVPIRLFVAQPFIVSGSSMSPTFETGQYLIIDQVTYEFKEPQRGDVIVFHYPRDPSKFFIKRIIGLPGEVVEIRGNRVLIRSRDETTAITLEEPYIQPENNRSDFLTTVLDDDEYFVMGDNRRASSDSRVWGPVERDLITGRAIIRLLPVTETDFLPGAYTHSTQ